MRAIFLLAALATPAAADVNRCATGETDLAWTGTDLATIAGDTGWFPSGSVAQLRLSGRVVGYTAVETGVRAQACWGQDGMKATFAGKPGGGWLDVAYGAEVSLKGRIKTSILGKSINWEGNIALPYIPMDLILEGQTAFDPAIDATKIARVADSTQPITLLSSNVIGDLINITGISGGLRVTVTPTMATTFRTKKAIVAGGTIDSAGDKVTIRPGERGFSGGHEVPISSEGVVRYEPILTFAASFDVKILGYRVVDWTLFSIPMNLPALERPIKLTGAAARLSLPVLEGIGEGARMDFATGTVQELAVRNYGEAPLAIEATKTPAGAIVSRVDLAPGAEGKLSVFVADDAAFANGPLEVTLATNDPDRGTVTVLLGKELGGTDPGVPPEEIGEAGGCSTGRGTGLGFGLMLLVALRRRRR